jgi:hypothetical protein
MWLVLLTLWCGLAYAGGATSESAVRVTPPARAAQPVEITLHDRFSNRDMPFQCTAAADRLQDFSVVVDVDLMRDVSLALCEVQ